MPDDHGWQEIGRHLFTLEDQIRFASFSGDHNPIHIDDDKAKKTIAGSVIVHGISSFLWSLEALTANIDGFPTRYQVTFKNYIRLNVEIACEWNKSKKLLRIIGPKKDVLCLIKYQEDQNIDKPLLDLPLPELKHLATPHELSSGAVSIGHTFQLSSGGNAELAINLYPNLVQRLGLNTVYEISLLSNIVGMQMPGLHSLFNGCKIELKERSKIRQPEIKVISFHKRFGVVKLQYDGVNIKGKMDAAIRPEYHPASCLDIKNKFEVEDIFHGKSFLIIGGSRGIGAACAKVFGLSGANITITYLNSKVDAEDVCLDIKTHTKTQPSNVQFDVLTDNFCDKFSKSFDGLLYFATPKIFDKLAVDFDVARFENFYQIYCHSFENISREYIESGGKLIYYPSTIAIEENAVDLEEYKAAKIIGEKICASLSNEHQVTVISDRLNRIQTDQTLTIMPTPAEDTMGASLKIANLIGLQIGVIQGKV